MKTLFAFLFLLTSQLSMEPITLFDFNKDCDLSNWYVMDDVVMGGRSDGNFQINEDGYGMYYGKVSLENNGGFSSIRYRLNNQNISAYTTCKIRLKSDGKKYQFRTKSEAYDRHSYIYQFETSGEWETISIPLSEMYPSWRGRKLDMPNYPVEQLEEIAFLIGNKKAESFELLFDWITLE